MAQCSPNPTVTTAATAPPVTSNDPHAIFTESTPNTRVLPTTVVDISNLLSPPKLNPPCLNIDMVAFAKSQSNSNIPGKDSCGISELLSAYNIDCDDLAHRYEEAQTHITNELKTMFSEREKMKSENAVLSLATTPVISSQNSTFVKALKPAVPVVKALVRSNKPAIGENDFLAINFKPGVSISDLEEIEPPLSLNLHSNEVQRCPECAAAYYSGAGLFYHYRRKELNNKSLQCPRCCVTIRNQCALYSHMRLHFLYEPYVCFLCGIEFGNREMLVDHTEAHGLDCRLVRQTSKHKLTAESSKTSTEKLEDDVSDGEDYCFTVTNESHTHEPKEVANGLRPPPKLILMPQVPRDSGTTDSCGRLSPANGLPHGELSGGFSAGNGNGGSCSTTCRLCHKVLSRRDKLKWHLAKCAPRYKRELYAELLAADFSEAISRNLVLSNGVNSASGGAVNGQLQLDCALCAQHFPSKAALDTHRLSCRRPAEKNQTKLSAPYSPRAKDAAVVSAPKQMGVECPAVKSQANRAPGARKPRPRPRPSRQSLINCRDPKVLERLTCQVCGRVLSRRDKLRRHLVRCCDAHSRDLEALLLASGFAPKDVSKALTVNTSVDNTTRNSIMTTANGIHAHTHGQSSTDREVETGDTHSSPASSPETFADTLLLHSQPIKLELQPNHELDIPPLPQIFPAIEIPPDTNGVSPNEDSVTSNSGNQIHSPRKVSRASPSNAGGVKRKCSPSDSADSQVDLVSSFPLNGKRVRYRCPNCPRMFEYKLAFSKHVCAN